MIVGKITITPKIGVNPVCPAAWRGSLSKDGEELTSGVKLKVTEELENL